MPDHHQVQRYYDEEYHKPDHGKPGSLPWHMRLIASRLEPLGDKSVLDVARGAGEWLKELQRRGAKPSGIDISKLAIQSARLRLPKADLREGVGEDWKMSVSMFTRNGGICTHWAVAGSIEDQRLLDSLVDGCFLFLLFYSIN